jgi:hypothetical protein
MENIFLSVDEYRRGQDSFERNQEEAIAEGSPYFNTHSFLVFVTLALTIVSRRSICLALSSIHSAMLEESLLHLKHIPQSEEISTRDLIRDAVLLILIGKGNMKEDKARKIAFHFEKMLYLGASTFSEYSNLKTLKLRLKKIAVEAQDQLSLRNATSKQKQTASQLEEYKAEPFNPVFTCQSLSHPDRDLRICSSMSRGVHRVYKLN